MSRNEYARYRGLSDEAVRKAVKTGRIVETPEGIDPVAADVAWAANTNQRKGGKRRRRPRSAAAPFAESATRPPAPPVPGTLSELQTEHEAVKLQRSRVQLRKLTAELVDRDLAEQKAYEFHCGVRDAWLVWPLDAADAIAADLGLADVALVRRVLEKHVRARLTALGAPKRPKLTA